MASPLFSSASRRRRREASDFGVEPDELGRVVLVDVRLPSGALFTLVAKVLFCAALVGLIVAAFSFGVYVILGAFVA